VALKREKRERFRKGTCWRALGLFGDTGGDDGWLADLLE
jgi:hypothetical protein